MATRKRKDNQRGDDDDFPSRGWPKKSVELLAYVVSSDQRTHNFIALAKTCGTPAAIFTGCFFVAVAIVVPGDLKLVIGGLATMAFVSPTVYRVGKVVVRFRLRNMEVSAKALGKAERQPGENGDGEGDGGPDQDSGGSPGDTQAGGDSGSGGDRA